MTNPPQELSRIAHFAPDFVRGLSSDDPVRVYDVACQLPTSLTKSEFSDLSRLLFMSAGDTMYPDPGSLIDRIGISNLGHHALQHGDTVTAHNAARTLFSAGGFLEWGVLQSRIRRLAKA